MAFLKRRKVEEIDLKIKEPITKEPSKGIVLYSEKINYTISSEYHQATSLEEKLNIIIGEQQEAIKKTDLITHMYYTIRVYAKIANKDRDFNAKLLDIDKQINRIRRDQDEFNRQIDSLKINDISVNIVDDIYNKLIQLKEFQQEIESRIKDINLQYFNHLKIATVNVTMNKTNKELDILHQNLNLFLGDFKSLNEAAEYIFFNSGQLLLSLVNSLIHCFLDYGKQEYINNYDFSYFLESDVIITLALKEWIELYNKIKFVMKITVDADLGNYLEFRKNFIQFELRYIILMMNMEGKNSNIASFNI